MSSNLLLDPHGFHTKWKAVLKLPFRIPETKDSVRKCFQFSDNFRHRLRSNAKHCIALPTIMISARQVS